MMNYAEGRLAELRGELFNLHELREAHQTELDNIAKKMQPLRGQIIELMAMQKTVKDGEDGKRIEDEIAAEKRKLEAGGRGD